jgi:hypothetical protein
VISLAVAAAGWVGVSSPGDYAAIEFPPTPRHDPCRILRQQAHENAGEKVVHGSGGMSPLRAAQ